MTNKADTRRKTLLVLTSTFPRWDGDGEPPFIFELSRRLTEEFEVVVLAPHAPGAKTKEVLGGLSVHRFRYCLNRWQVLAYEGGIMAKLNRHFAYYLLVPFFLISQLIAMLRIVKREKIDVIHAHWLIPQGLVSTACRLFLGSDFPALLCTSHGTDLLGLKGSFFSSIKRKVLEGADAVTTVSRAMKDYAQQLGAATEKLFVIPMGIDATGIFTPASIPERKTNELLFVGRLVKSKGVDSLISAMPAILDQHPTAVLSIVGDGPERAKLEALTRSLQISKNVHFTGAVANSALPDLYRRATVFISPSLSEGFGLTLAEALACECPVVASDLPAIREIISNGETGFIVSPGHTEEIALKVQALLNNPTLARSLGRAGRELVVARFDWNIVARNYAKLIHQLCSGQGA